MAEPWIRPDLAVMLGGLTEEQVAVCTVYGEARSEPPEGIIAVAWAIRHRVESGRWGATYQSVCLAPWQFSCWSVKGGEGNHQRVVALVEQMARGVPVDEAAAKQVAFLTHGVIKGYLKDTIKGAMHYHTVSLTPRPKWAQSVVPVAQRGAHVFYAGVK